MVGSSVKSCNRELKTNAIISESLKELLISNNFVLGWQHQHWLSREKPNYLLNKYSFPDKQNLSARKKEFKRSLF